MAIEKRLVPLPAPIAPKISDAPARDYRSRAQPSMLNPRLREVPARGSKGRHAHPERLAHSIGGGGVVKHAAIRSPCPAFGASIVVQAQVAGIRFRAHPEAVQRRGVQIAKTHARGMSREWWKWTREEAAPSSVLRQDRSAHQPEATMAKYRNHGNGNPRRGNRGQPLMEVVNDAAEALHELCIRTSQQALVAMMEVRRGVVRRVVIESSIEHGRSRLRQVTLEGCQVELPVFGCATPGAR